jgi:hypothetical protein
MKKILFLSTFFILQNCYSNEITEELTLEYHKDAAGAVSKSFLIKMRDLFNIKNFVETGTYLGDTTINAANVFNKAYTVEIDSKLYHNALAKFNKLSKNNIFAALNNSTAFIHQILPLLSEPTLFFLDAHWSEGITGKLGNQNTPILDELKAIASLGKRQNYILVIDDLRFFQPSEVINQLLSIPSIDPSVWGYPELSEVKKLTLLIFDQPTLIAYGDAAIIYDKSINNIKISPVVKAMTTSKEADFNLQISNQELVTAHTILSQATMQEFDALKDLATRLPQPAILRANYLFWYAQALNHKGQTEKAKLIEKEYNISALTNRKQALINK